MASFYECIYLEVTFLSPYSEIIQQIDPRAEPLDASKFFEMKGIADKVTFSLVF